MQPTILPGGVCSNEWIPRNRRAGAGTDWRDSGAVSSRTRGYLKPPGDAVFSDGTSTAREIHYYDGQKVLAEFAPAPDSGTGSLKRYFVDGPTYINEHLPMYAPAPGPPSKDYFYVPQELHTVSAMVGASGKLAEA